jgi:F-type H+-transporting ATPase subunit b
MINLDFSLVVTILYLIILYAFMSRFFFGPVLRVLDERRQLIEGRLENAHQRMAQAEQKAAEYESALKAARTEVYRGQETHREKALSERAGIVMEAKASAEKAVQEGRSRIAAEAAAARKHLEGEVDNLAGRLTTSILRD